MTDETPPNDSWQESQIPLQDVVLSNSWALQAILQYLDELNPGARDRIWQHYLLMKAEAEKSLQQPRHTSLDETEFDDEEE